MSVALRWNFLTERGKQIAEAMTAKQALLESCCSCPQEPCQVDLRELQDGRLQVTVVRPRAVIAWEDWFAVSSSAHSYRRTFDNPCADEVTRSIAQFIERPLVERAPVGTVEEFLEELREVRGQFDWRLEPDDRWAVDRRAWLRFRLRGAPQSGPAEGITLDPIGVVCYARMGKIYEPECWEEAARTIGLPLAIAAALIAASNHRTWRVEDGTRKPDQHLEWLRSRLVGVLGPIFPPNAG